MLHRQCMVCIIVRSFRLVLTPFVSRFASFHTQYNYRGEGDSHDRRHDEQGVTAVLVSSDPEETKLPLNNSTYTYTLSIYPNQKLYDSYSTSNPQTACITAVFAIVLTSLLFVLYDFFVHRDISKKKNLLEAKRQFVRFVSHEVRTPLNSVCMGLVLLQEEIALSLGYKSTEALLKAEKEDRVVQGAASKKQGDKVIIAKSLDWFDLAHEVQVNARSGVDVLNDLLNYDKIESNTLTLELTVVPIWELIESTVYEFKVPSATKKIDLKLKLPTDGDAHLKLKLPNGDADDWKQHPKDAVAQKVIGDSVRITQVLRNLVSNALKFTPEDGNLYVEAQWIHHRDTTATKPIEMEFELKNHETIVAPCSGMLEIKVTDTGAGMSPEQLARLFQKGVQFNVNELQAGNGSGLGLFIAKGIVEQHGGSLTCSSQGLGKGTTFTMSIPLYNLPDPEKSSGDIEDGANMDMSFEERSLRVLIVDDATSNRKLLRRLLQNRQHVCDECEDGQQAVEKVIEAEAKSDPFDVILLDYEMPVMNGPTAAREIRKLGCDAFLVGITGNLMAEDVEYFRSMGANAVLPKPFSIKALEELMVENDVGGGKEDTGAGMFRVSSNTQLEIAGEMVTLSQRYDTDEGMNDSLSSSKMTALAERFGVDASMDIDTSDALSF
jgi:signal transduction histidine kinase/CheY-like chemotaxis protein